MQLARNSRFIDLNLGFIQSHTFRTFMEGADEQHAQWLKERIVTLGGEVPRISVSPEDGTNTWKDLSLDLSEEKRRLWDLEEQLPVVEQIDPESAKVLHHILEDERKHHEVIIDMLMRTDPQAEWAWLA